MNPPPPLPSKTERFARRYAAGLKLLFVGALALLLLAPLGFVRATLDERLGRHDRAVETVTQSWGKAQRLLGPVLVVPYTWKTDTEEWITADGKRSREKLARTHVAEAFFLPERFEVDGQIEPSARRLGIYSTHVYAAKLRLQGRFAGPSLAFTNIAEVAPQWDRARVCFAITDLRGTRGALALQWGGAEVALQPGARLEGFGAGLHAPVKLAANGGALDFALELTLNGSGGLTFVPLGRQTAVKLASPWPAPGFHGAFLPVQRTVAASGFDASWEVGYYGRDFPQQWSSGMPGIATAASTPAAPAAQALEASAFGVNLVEPLTAYRTIERAIKYGVLFLALVFVTFFLFEVLSAVRLNALNYLLVGGALCLFYLGLLSLAEFIGFAAAYTAAAAASLLLIGLYSRAILRSGGRALLVCAMLGGVYGYLYFVLQMEDFALLAGTAALFALLAAVMFATRRIGESDNGSAAALGATEAAP